MYDSKIFITGKVQGSFPSELEEFQLAKEKLIAAGFQHITTAADNLPEDTSWGALKFYQESRDKNFREAYIVLHLYNYDQDKKALLDVRMAHYSLGEKRCFSFNYFLNGIAKREIV